MKKIVLSICAVAIVALATVNLNLVNNSKSIAGLSLGNIVALAQGEDSCNNCQYKLKNVWCVRIKVCLKPGEKECSITSGYRDKCPDGSGSCASSKCD